MKEAAVLSHKRRRNALVIAVFATISARLAVAAEPPQYTVIDLGTLGGSLSLAFGINNEGEVDGRSTLPGDVSTHAFLWGKGVMTDLGTLGGPNSAASWPLNERGDVPVSSDTTTLDPNGEDFCGFGTNLICLPGVWHEGVLTALPTLGGNNGNANEVNSRGQIAGLAEIATLDPTCTAPEVLGFLPVIWDKGQAHVLPTFPGDSTGVAFVINDSGQAAGASSNCSGTTTVHALLWENGVATDLGNLGGTFNNLPQDINNQGQVVGLSDLFGDTNNHAFLWQNGVMTDLGTLPGDVNSVAFGINEKGQVVGRSRGRSGPRAFLWQDGVMTDLNTLIPAGSPLHLNAGFGINARGQIAGNAVQLSTGQIHVFLATPCEGCASTAGAAARAEIQSPEVVIPEKFRPLLERRAGSPGLWRPFARPW